MSKKTTTCPHCLGAKETMVPRETRGFKHEKCKLCNGTGEVTHELAEDYVISLNEDIVDDYESNDYW